jgi:phosphoribosylaminoimidazolecarboxamide formyltransferase/IMP cyclohydrolase
MSKRALISVSNKSNIVQFAKYLIENDYTIISTGGTANHLRCNNIAVTDLADYTKFPEILGGRVKTLHPLVYGGILNVNDNVEHQQEMKNFDITNIDMVIVNLYPFEKVVASTPKDEATCIENIDIGGVCLLRAAAKNYANVLVFSNSDQYLNYIEFPGDVDRKKLAIKAFEVTTNYDSAINAWMSGHTGMVTRKYIPQIELKYGCNPHQKNAKVFVDKDMYGYFPFKVLNGSPGYINILDAINAWNLVRDIRTSLDMDAAASFKHVSPAGVALGTPLIDFEESYFKVDKTKVSNIAIAYLRARNCDPKSSFGDFISVNKKVDISLANIIKTCVSDGIIAPGYDPMALEILKEKKKGGFIILESIYRAGDSTTEYKEFHGCVLSQTVNNEIINMGMLNNIVSKKKELSENVKRDMIMSMITLKYTQSNSVAYAYKGQMIGIGAGQQSRIDCVRLARMKAETWLLRRSQRVLDLKFIDGIKKQDKINSIIQYIEDDFTPIEYNLWKQSYDQIPEPYTDAEKSRYVGYTDNVILASDAFFPFRDSIDKASKVGVKYVVHPGGSIADETVLKACDEYGMVLVNTNFRLFHH